MSASLLIEMPASDMSRVRRVDLTPMAGNGYDEILHGVASAAMHYVESGYWTVNAAYTCLMSVREAWFPWLEARAHRMGEELTFDEISRDHLQDFIVYLKANNKYQTAASKYSAVMQVLCACEEAGLTGSIAAIRPIKPFPGVAAHSESSKPYSRRERKALAIALRSDLDAIRSGTFPSSELEEIVVYYLSLQLRTGFNAGPLISLSRNALIEHPLRPGYKLLVAYKERAHKEVSQPVKWHESVEELSVCQSDVASLYAEILARTELWSLQLGGLDRAFIRPPLATGKDEDKLPVSLTLVDITNKIHNGLAKRHALQGDDGKLLVPSGRRFRATLAERAFELSDGDPLVVAHVLGNAISVAKRSYVKPSSDVIAEFAVAANVFVERLSKAPELSVHKTPVGGCTDPLMGRYAPKDGVKYCEKWLHCFSCPNQCITGDDQDLWRIYSFYWMLQKKASVLRISAVSGMFRFVIHVLDVCLVDKYGDAARSARQRSRLNPHPFWLHGELGAWIDVE